MKKFLLCFLASMWIVFIINVWNIDANEPLQPCPTDSDVMFYGTEYSNISALRDSTIFYGWDVDLSENAIYTWWSHDTSGVDIWVAYEAYLTEGIWNIGLCAINHHHEGDEGLGVDPDWYPQFEISNSLTNDIIIVPASDSVPNSGYFQFDVTSEGYYEVVFRWLNDQAWGEQEDGTPILDANIKILKVFFDKIPELLSIDIHPDTLNLKSKGNYITCYIEMPEADVNLIDLSTVTMTIGENTIKAELFPTEIGDYNYNGIPDLMVKFDRESVQEACDIGAIDATVYLETTDYKSFQGNDIFLVIDKGKEHVSQNQDSIIY